MSIVPTPESDRARFWAKVVKEAVERVAGLGPCWIWTAGCHPTSGYGHFRLNRRSRRAHMVAYEWCVGPIPDGLFVCHRCDVRRCVNPGHLELGTHHDNMRDMVERGRTATGLRNGSHVHGLTKLSDADVLDIYTRVHAGEPQDLLAAEYDIEQTMVSHIKRGTRWKHLLPEGHQTLPEKHRPSKETILAVREMGQQGLSQSTIAATLGMSQPAVSRILNGRAYTDVV